MRYKKPTKKQIAAMKKYWKLMESETDCFNKTINIIEIMMKNDKNIGIKDIEFFWSDDRIVGIGNASKTINLFQKDDFK